LHFKPATTVNRSLQIALLYNAPVLSPDDREYSSEAGVLDSVTAIKSALVEAGYAAVDVVAADSLAALIERFAQLRPDVVVNLCESWRGDSAHEPHMAALFELLGIAYTGSPPECLALVRDKARTKRLLSGTGIATADFIEVPLGQSPPESLLRRWLADGPVFIKPAHEDASLGISFASVTSEWAALKEQIIQTHRKYGTALVERYIAGREFNVGIVELPEPNVLPLAEIEFRSGPEAIWPILTYAGKWSPNSTDDLATPIRCPANVETTLARRIEEIAVAAYRLTGCRDYARVDVRVDPQGQIFVLEVNANPDIGPQAGFAIMLRAQNISYEEFAQRLVDNAYRRATVEAKLQCLATTELNRFHAKIGNTSESNAAVEIRALQADDVPCLIDFTHLCGFFRPDEVDIAAELLNEALRDGPAGHYQVLVAELDGRQVGWSCHGRVPLTDATFDLYWIVVSPVTQRAGVGRTLLSAIEQKIDSESARWLLAETSSTDQYKSTRQFYLRCGFVVVSQIDDFYRPGDGRVIFGKRIDRYENKLCQ
jgi:D-alanine-D-alanine ligase